MLVIPTGKRELARRIVIPMVERDLKMVFKVSRSARNDNAVLEMTMTGSK